MAILSLRQKLFKLFEEKIGMNNNEKEKEIEKKEVKREK
jgi:hypothetical protein